jgi:4-amino-4-deoxy-L-arabinose transferase-like glycosyltransferase
MLKQFPKIPADPSADEPFIEAPGPRVLSPATAWTLLLLVFLAVHFVALFTPSLMDDADATHAQAAQHMALTGDWVTLKVNGIRYLEKPPLPYWLVAVDYLVFGFNVFSTHLPMTLGVLAGSILAWIWARRAYGDRAAFYAALAVMTSVGVFLFTRMYIPEAILSVLIAFALYCFLTGFEDSKPSRFYLCYASLALAVLAKGLIAPVFFVAAAVPYLFLTGLWRRWRELRLGTGLLLFLAIAAPWHVLAGLRNPDQGHPVGNIPSPGNVHGFFYFYFMNEHVLRFLGKRYPHDYNKQMGIVFWLGHLIWLFPWSIFFPLAVKRAWETRCNWMHDLRPDHGRTVHFYIERAHLADPVTLTARAKFRARTNLLLALYAGFILVFFSISTNQEYYTYPAYFALLMLTAGALAAFEDRDADKPSRWITGGHAAFAMLGVAAAAALGYGLWSARHLPFVPDIGTLLAHRGVGDYSLSMSHFFDLTGPSFAALRLPAVLAAVALLFGPLLAWALRRRGHHLEATASIGLTAAVFLVAAHIAFVRFQPMLSSRAMADTILSMEGGGGPTNATPVAPREPYQLILYGDQADGSSIIFYTGRQALLDNHAPADDPCPGTTSMLWGSCYPDAPHIFINDAQLLAGWGSGPRKFLFVPGDWHDHVEALLGSRAVKLQELSDKTLYTDRPAN